MDCVEGDTSAADFLEDLVGAGGPVERLRVGVMGGELGLDRVDEVGDRVEDPAADRFDGEPGEEDFDHVQP